MPYAYCITWVDEDGENLDKFILVVGVSDMSKVGDLAERALFSIGPGHINCIKYLGDAIVLLPP